MADLNIFLLPGLGFDGRIFERLNLPERTKALSWLVPLKKESIADYALRMGEEYLGEGSSILIGHSFGGIMAQEMAKWFSVEQIILISSIKSPAENPMKFRALAPFGIHRFFTKELTLKTFPYWAASFGYAEEEEQELFKAMVAEQDNRYLQWALYQLSKWKGVQNLKTRITQIHGDQDHTFPISKIQSPDHIVSGGSHMMVYSQANEIEKLIYNSLTPPLK